MRFFMVILTIMSLLCSTIVSFLYPADIAQAEDREELFLVRVISIDEAKSEMILEIFDEKHNDRNEQQTGSNEKQNDKEKNIDETIIYSFQSVPESLKQGDIIRIWGTMDRSVSMDTTGFHNSGKISVIKGKIAGMSNRTGDDPTGVRKRLKRRINSHPPSSRGGARGQP